MNVRSEHDLARLRRCRRPASSSTAFKAVFISCCLVLAAASQTKHCGSLPRLFSSRIEISIEPTSGFAQLHIPLAEPLGCPGTIYAIMVKLHNNSGKVLVLRHRFSVHDMVDWLGSSKLVFHLPNIPEGDHTVTVKIFDTFPLLSPEDMLLAAGTYRISAPKYMSTLDRPVLLTAAKPREININILKAAFENAGFDFDLEGSKRFDDLGPDDAGDTNFVLTSKSISSNVGYADIHRGTRNQEACIQEEESVDEIFERNSWFLNVFSESNYTQSCCLFGTQLSIVLEGAVVGNLVLGRAWGTPAFISQPRDNAATERMIRQKLQLNQDRNVAGGAGGRKARYADPYFIMGTFAVPCNRLFRCDRHSFAGSFQQRVLSLDQLYARNNAVLDHLIVSDAGIIGGQACASSVSCDRVQCQTLHNDTGGSRYMELHGLQFWVKKVSCLPGQYLGSQAMLRKLKDSHDDKLVAVATGPGDYGQSIYTAIFPDRDTYSVNEKWNANVEELLEQLEPAPHILEMVDRLCTWLSRRASSAPMIKEEVTVNSGIGEGRGEGGAGGGGGGEEEGGGGSSYGDSKDGPDRPAKGRPERNVSQFLTAHWRRGDRGHSEMGPYGQDHWHVSRPANFGCLINRMVLESGIKTVFVATNSGSDDEKLALRDVVYQGSGGFVVFWEDLVEKHWRRELEHMLAEVFVCARGEMFLSAGRSFMLSSQISMLVHVLRLFRLQREQDFTDASHARRAVAASTRWLAECALPAAHELSFNSTSHRWEPRVAVSVHSVGGAQGVTIRVLGLSNRAHYRVVAVVSSDCRQLLEVQVSDTFPSETEFEDYDEPYALPALYDVWRAQAARERDSPVDVANLKTLRHEEVDADPALGCIPVRLSCPPHDIFDLHATRCPPLLVRLVLAFERDEEEAPEGANAPRGQA